MCSRAQADVCAAAARFPNRRRRSRALLRGARLSFPSPLSDVHAPAAASRQLCIAFTAAAAPETSLLLRHSGSRCSASMPRASLHRRFPLLARLSAAGAATTSLLRALALCSVLLFLPLTRSLISPSLLPSPPFLRCGQEPLSPLFDLEPHVHARLHSPPVKPSMILPRPASEAARANGEVRRGDSRGKSGTPMSSRQHTGWASRRGGDHEQGRGRAPPHARASASRAQPRLLSSCLTQRLTRSGPARASQASTVSSCVALP